MSEQFGNVHQMTADDVCRQLHTDAARGLSREAARSRFKKQGRNTLFDPGRSAKPRLVRSLLSDAILLFALLAALLSCFFLQPLSGVALLICLVFCACITLPLFRKWRIHSERIHKYRIPTVRVVREGRVLLIFANRVVRGDILLLHAGDIVPCDCRMIEGKELRVLTLLLEEEGRSVYRELPKSAAFVYPYGAHELPPYHTNMLFGGSEILCGEVRAVAVAVGARTYLGSNPAAEIPAEVTAKKSGRDASNALLPYFKAYSWCILASLLILFVIGLFTLPKSYRMMELFLPLCILAGATAPALLLLYIRMLRMNAELECMKAPPRDRAAVKSDRSLEVLSRVTDLFLIGHKALTDGISHFHAAMIPSGEFSENTTAEPLLEPLAEAFFLLKSANRGLSATIREEGESDGSFLSELERASGIDLSALSLRLESASLVSESRTLRIVEARLTGQTCRYLFSEDLRLLGRCQLAGDRGRTVALSAELRERFSHFCRSQNATSARTLIVARQYSDGAVVLLGVLSMKEALQASVRESLHLFDAMGMRVTFLLKGTLAQEQRFADAVGLPSARILCKEGTPHLTPAHLNTARVAIGFSSGDLPTLLEEMRREGRRVAVLCGSAEDRALLSRAATVIACDDTEYHRAHADEMILEDQPTEGRENSTRAAQVVRRHADLIIHRADVTGGGLSALAIGCSKARVLCVRMQMLLEFLCLTQLSRFLVVFCSLLFGIGIWNGSMMLYASIFTELCGALRILSASVPREDLNHARLPDGARLFGILRDPQCLLCTGLAIMTSILTCAILVWCGVTSPGVSNTALFLSFLLFVGILQVRSAPGRDAWKFFLAILLPILILLPFSILFPAVGRITGLGAYSPVSMILIPLLPLSLLLFQKILTFLKRTAK